MALRPVALAAVVLSFALLSACAPGGASVDDFIAGNGSISIVTLAMSDGTTFLEYEDDITAQGGAGSYSWSLAGGALPPGLTLTGGTPTATIAGTPSLAGTFDFTIRATDQTGRSATQDLTIDVSRPTLTVNDPLVDEGDSGAVTMTFTVTLSPAIGIEVEVDYTTADITASSVDLDYLDTSGSLTFSPGATSRSFDVLVVGDTDYENGVDETFKVILSGAVNADIGGFGIGTIANDDLVGASIADATLTEGDGGNSTMRFTVSLDNPASQVVRIDYTTTAGTATAGADYTTVSNQVQFTPNTSTQQINYIDVLITGDVIAEISETFTVTLSNPSGCTLIDDTATGTITDNGDDAQIDIDASQSVPEGAITESTPMVFTVTLSNVQTLASDITVDYDVIDGTATEAGAGGPADGTNDYDVAAGVSGTLTFTASPFVTTQTITITVNGDDFGEGHEDFTVDLSGLTGNGGNAALGVASGTGTISSDDPPSISVDDWDTNEKRTGITTMDFTVSITHYAGTGITYSMQYDIVGVTATAGVDYDVPAGVTGTVSFTEGIDGLTKTVSVDVNGDTTVETDETLSITLSDAGGLNGATFSDAAGIGTIWNDDGSAPADRFTFDFNGDTLPDLIIGADGASSSQGRAYVFLGRPGGFPSSLSSSVADIVIVGEAGTSHVFGRYAVGIKDINDDGCDDFAVGAEGYDVGTDTDEGAAYIFFGCVSGIDINGFVMPDPGDGATGGAITINANVDDYPHMRLLGDNPADALGEAIASAGDFDNDGTNDFVLGARQSGAALIGKAYILLGDDGSTKPEFDPTTFAAYPYRADVNDDADVTITGEAVSHRFGNTALGVGDFDGDGFDDVLIGANAAPSNGRGKCYLVLGRATPPATLNMATAGERDLTITYDPTGGATFNNSGNMGISAAYLGNVNSDTMGDVYDDLLIGAHQQDDTNGNAFNGAVHVVYGRTSVAAGAIDPGLDRTLALPGDVKIRHTVGSALAGADQAKLGISCCGIGDFDGDTFNDFAIGAHQLNVGGTDRGEVLIIRGGTANLTAIGTAGDESDAYIRFQGSTDLDLLGQSVASVGDLDGDNLNELIIGAPQDAATQNGTCYVLSGGTGMGTLDAETAVTGGSAFKLTGANIGDLFSRVRHGH